MRGVLDENVSGSDERKQLKRSPGNNTRKDAINVDINNENAGWASLSHEEKNRILFLRQKKTLDTFLEHGAISQAQHDKSLHDLIEKMGMEAEVNTDAEQV